MKPIEQLQLATSLYMTTRLRCLLNMHALWYLSVCWDYSWFWFVWLVWSRFVASFQHRLKRKEVAGGEFWPRYW